MTLTASLSGSIALTNGFVTQLSIPIPAGTWFVGAALNLSGPTNNNWLVIPQFSDGRGIQTSELVYVPSYIINPAYLTVPPMLFVESAPWTLSLAVREYDNPPMLTLLAGTILWAYPDDSSVQAAILAAVTTTFQSGGY